LIGELGERLQTLAGEGVVGTAGLLEQVGGVGGIDRAAAELTQNLLVGVLEPVGHLGFTLGTGGDVGHFFLIGGDDGVHVPSLLGLADLFHSLVVNGVEGGPVLGGVIAGGVSGKALGQRLQTG